MIYSLKNKKVYVAGHSGLVGYAVTKLLQENYDVEIITAPRQELDLTDSNAVNEFICQKKPDVVLICAAQVGGIVANATYPADFIYNNISIQNNLIHSSYINGVEKLAFLGTVCMYPKQTKQPIKEQYLLSDYLEPTNQPYSIAKIAGVEMCKSYRKQYGFDAISIIPCNIYGDGDNYDLEKSHVIPGLIHRLHLAKQNNDNAVEVWGTGKPSREFMHSRDCASAILHIVENYSDLEIINAGSNQEISIYDLAHLIQDIVGYKGEIKFDTTKPDGVYRRIMDSKKLYDLGWQKKYELKQGLELSYKDFLENFNTTQNKLENK